ncbi:hypothetical protein L484_007812 [Morus notabilis]|uniref:Uncharacterized protein n=1 Tax=Morus notabilis TaxID=981085 RepID=W9S730_9ROSA|nr:hypothetical protein L484_007812 [Morus notabilis]
MDREILDSERFLAIPNSTVDASAYRGRGRSSQKKGERGAQRKMGRGEREAKRKMGRGERGGAEDEWRRNERECMWKEKF